MALDEPDVGGEALVLIIVDRSLLISAGDDDETQLVGSADVTDEAAVDCVTVTAVLAIDVGVDTRLALFFLLPPSPLVPFVLPEAPLSELLFRRRYDSWPLGDATRRIFKDNGAC